MYSDDGRWPFLSLWYAISKIIRNGYDNTSNYMDLTSALAYYASDMHLLVWLVGVCGKTVSDDRINRTKTYVNIMITCEGIMVLELLLLLYCRSRPILPRQPMTLASRLLLVYATDIIRFDFGSSVCQYQKTPGAEEAETLQISGAVSQPALITQGILNLSKKYIRETTIQKINLTNVPAMSSIELSNLTTSLRTTSNSPQTTRRWWNIFSRKGKGKRKRSRTWSDFVEDGDPRVCALGSFTGRDGKPHVGIGKHGAGMTKYRMSKERQDKVDEGSTYKSKQTKTKEVV